MEETPSNLHITHPLMDILQFSEQPNKTLQLVHQNSDKSSHASVEICKVNDMAHAPQAGIEERSMDVSEHTIQHLTFSHWTWTPESAAATSLTSPLQAPKQPKFDWLKPLRQRLDNLEISDREFAHWLCKLIPSQCPFERTITVFGHTVLHIPPLCKLNPLYEEVVGLRFRALCYLADQCGEDVSIYC